MALVWFLVGLVAGAAAVWWWLERKSAERVAAVETGWDRRLRHGQEEVRQADAAHEETKQRLIASELAVRGLEAELAEAGKALAAGERQRSELGGELEQARAALARARHALEDARIRRGMIETTLAEAWRATARVRHALEDARKRRGMIETTLAEAWRATARVRHALEDARMRRGRIETTLAAAWRATEEARAGRRAAEEALAYARSDLDAQQARFVELEARLVTARPPAAETVADAPAPALDAMRQRLKQIDARLAMLPAGSSARTRLIAEKARLQAGRDEHG